ncbi:MAG: DUF3822 family protein [Chitinophagales bacterium]|jgi:hypothetical protein|nr:DUF3822 family protein [Chitinophagales bacterium]
MSTAIHSSYIIPGALYGAAKSIPANPGDFSLRALITPNQLAVLISENKSKKIFQLQPFQFAEHLSKSAWVASINSIIQNEWFFKQEWSIKKIAVFLPDFTLIPRQFYSMETRETFISWNIATDQEDACITDSVDGTDINLIYSSPKQLLWPPHTEIRHSLTVLLRYLLQWHNISRPNNIYTYIQQSSFQLIYFKDRSLHFCNSFNFHSPDDFTYYLLFACKQLNLNPESLTVTFMGEIMRESSLFRLLSRYVHNVEFAQMPTEWQFDKDYTLPGHFFYNLFCI